MSMYRVRRRRNRWKHRWPWKHIFPARVDERFCSECGLQYLADVLPEPVARFGVINVEALVFPDRGWRRDKFVIRLGRWKPGGDKYYFSEFVPAEELDDVFAVLEKTRQSISALQAKARARAK